MFMTLGSKGTTVLNNSNEITQHDIQWEIVHIATWCTLYNRTDEKKIPKENRLTTALHASPTETSWETQWYTHTVSEQYIQV
jgi:hypothetical protein